IGGMSVTVLASRARRSDLYAVLIGLLSVALVLYALAPTRVLVVAASAVLGAMSSSTIITSITTVQRDAPNHSRGRVLSLFQAFAGVTYGFGLLLLGVLGDTFNLRAAFVAGAVANLVFCVVLAARLPRWREAIDGESAGPGLAVA
ncbi:MAG: MFS transporter, partial [Rhodanobacteraceae bacterium]|nr:MFS transporter [Rhodanobacteraceae bacterium]